jgi:hypothetical protein
VRLKVHDKARTFYGTSPVYLVDGLNAARLPAIHGKMHVQTCFDQNPTKNGNPGPISCAQSLQIIGLYLAGVINRHQLPMVRRSRHISGKTWFYGQHQSIPKTVSGLCFRPPLQVKVSEHAFFL